MRKKLRPGGEREEKEEIREEKKKRGRGKERGGGPPQPVSLPPLLPNETHAGARSRRIASCIILSPGRIKRGERGTKKKKKGGGE